MVNYRRDSTRGVLFCSRCSTEKPLSEFHRKRESYAARCKNCSAEIQAFLKYGVSPDRYQEMLQAQSVVCAICKQPERYYSRLAIDHDHACCPGKKSCGKCVRGLLCRNCNHMLGAAQDNPKLLKRAAKYIERNK